MSRWRSRAVFAVVATLFILAAIYLSKSSQQTAEHLSPKVLRTTSSGALVELDSAGRSVGNGSGSGSSSGSSSGSGVGGDGSRTTTHAAQALRSGVGRGAASGVGLPSASPQAVRRPPLTAVCVSDTHGLHMEEGLLKVPEGDLLLFPGDAGVGTAAEGRAFSRWLERLPVRGPRVVTWGNMDTGTPGLIEALPGATLIVNAIQEVSGYRIFASPWTPRFAGAYQLDLGPDESYDYWSKLLPANADVDIILTHGPPYGVADKTGGRHRGDMGLLRAVQALQKPPLLWVCGHIHEQYGEHRVPHARAPGGSFPLLNSAVFYASQPRHAQSAQPRAVRLPEAQVLPRGG